MLTCVNLLARLGLAWLGSAWLASLCWLSLCWLSSLQFPWKKSKKKKSKKSKKKCYEIASTKNRVLCRGRIMRPPSDGGLTLVRNNSLQLYIFIALFPQFLAPLCCFFGIAFTWHSSLFSCFFRPRRPWQWSNEWWQLQRGGFRLPSWHLDRSRVFWSS